jgi:hypothetical protein
MLCNVHTNKRIFIQTPTMQLLLLLLDPIALLPAAAAAGPCSTPACQHQSMEPAALQPS